jgi:outer membrane protein TolC
VENHRLGVELAKQAYKPGLALDLSYGFRRQSQTGVERPDFLSLMLMFDLPVFTAHRQDRRLADSRKQLEASELSREDRLRRLRSRLDDKHASWRRLGERLRQFEKELLAQARLNARAALRAYQNDAADFATLARAGITELNTELKAMRVRVDHAKVQAALLYLAGDA